jgi:multiple sugar transport system permease protein
MNENKSAYLYLSPYLILFFTFIVVPVVVAIFLSLTFFNTVDMPNFIGLQNFIDLFTKDEVFMQNVLPNTITFALVVGPGGYLLSFFLAWSLAQISHIPRTILALIIYSPSMTAGIAMQVIWTIVFNGDRMGYLNAVLMNWGLIDAPIQWLQSPDHLMSIMIAVSLWGSMGVGFLAMLAGVLNIDQSIYEAAYIDGISNRFQEIFFITIPSMKPQMLFGAVMAVVGTFQAGAIGVQLSGANPTPQNAGQLMVNHIEDYGFIRYEMGYAAAISVVLLIGIYVLSKFSWKLFGEKD